MDLHITAKITVANYTRPPLRLELPTGREILLEIAEHHGLTVADLQGPERTYKYTRPRQHAMWALRRRGLSYPRIGQLLHRDHTTCILGVRRHEHYRKRTPDAPGVGKSPGARCFSGAGWSLPDYAGAFQASRTAGEHLLATGGSR